MDPGAEFNFSIKSHVQAMFSIVTLPRVAKSIARVQTEHMTVDKHIRCVWERSHMYDAE